MTAVLQLLRRTAILGALLSLTSSCLTEDGACEFATDSGGTMEYGCYDESADSCEFTESLFGDAYYHSDVSCYEIGYDLPSGYSYSWATPGGTSPSSDGYYAGGGGYSGGSGGGGSSGDGRCTSSYAGPEFDIQVDSFCKAAWNYLCNSNDADAAAANCQIYRQWQSDNPGIPSCPYC